MLNNAEYTYLMGRLDELAFPPAKSDEDVDDGGSPSVVSVTEGNPDLGILESEKVAFKADLALMRDLVFEKKSLDESEGMEDVDEQRDDVVGYFVVSVKRMKQLTIPGMDDAIKKVYDIVKPYFGVAKLPLNQETVSIDGMLADLSREDIPECVERMGLKPILEQIQALNDEYKRLDAERAKARAAIERESGKDVRARMDVLFDDMTTAAFVQSAANPTETNTAFIKDLNDLIDAVKSAYNNRMAQREEDKKEEEGKKEEGQKEEDDKTDGGTTTTPETPGTSTDPSASTTKEPGTATTPPETSTQSKA